MWLKFWRSPREIEIDKDIIMAVRAKMDEMRASGSTYEERRAVSRKMICEQMSARRQELKKGCWELGMSNSGRPAFREV